MSNLFRKGQVFTIPNLMSLFRLILVPFIVWAYVGLENTGLTIALLAVSALTDVLDGQIARRFNMISELGKALDPLADKITQVSVVLCLAFKYKLMWVLLAVCVIRELAILYYSYVNVRKTGKVQGAKWYGKLSTVLLYATSLALLIFPNMPEWLSTALIILCICAVLLALTLYTLLYIRLWREHDEAEKQKKAENPSAEE